MIRCVVIDDEPLARQLLSDFIKRVPELSLEGSFSSALKSLELLRKKQADVLFLDIQMPDITGIEFLKTLDNKPLVIFTTAFAEHALQGYELDVADYLLKPFDFNRFLKSINKISQRLQNPIGKAETITDKRDAIFVKDGTKLVKIELATIRYIKGAREYATIVTPEKKIMSLQTMKSLEEMLPTEFVRIHNSYIIPLAAIDTVFKNRVQVGQDVFPIGITYKKKFFEEFQAHYPGRSISES
jgi:two-component system, LytTR family, response regulator